MGHCTPLSRLYNQDLGTQTQTCLVCKIMKGQTQTILRFQMPVPPITNHELSKPSFQNLWLLTYLVHSKVEVEKYYGRDKL